MNNVDVKQFFNKLIAQNHGDESDFPQDLLFRFHGKDCVEVFFTTIKQTEYMPVHRVDQAKFKPRTTIREE